MTDERARVIEALIEEVTLELTYERRHVGGTLEALDNSFNRGLEAALEVLHDVARRRGVFAIVPSRTIDPKTAMFALSVWGRSVRPPLVEAGTKKGV